MRTLSFARQKEELRLAERVNILGVDVDAVTMAEAVDVVRRAMDTRAGVMVATANAEMLMRATHDEELRRILNASALVVPDGAGTVWAARHLGHAMPERVAGYDLAQELLRCAPAEGHSVYFFGSAPGVAEKAKAKAEQLYPGIEIVGVRNGFFSLRTMRRSLRRFAQHALTSCSSRSVCRSRRSGSPRISQSLTFPSPSASAGRSTSWRA